jgi:hypothetical protein
MVVGVFRASAEGQSVGSHNNRWISHLQLSQCPEWLASVGRHSVTLEKDMDSHKKTIKVNAVSLLIAKIITAAAARSTA